MSSTHILGRDMDYHSLFEYLKEIKENLPEIVSAKNKQVIHLPVFDSTIDISNYLQELADYFVDFLLLPKKIKIVFTDETNSLGAYYEVDDKNLIVIKAHSDYTLELYIAVLAHEITHYYLSYHKYKTRFKGDNEFATDICAVYLGFGFMLYKAYKQETETTVYGNMVLSSHRKVGYLTDQSIQKAIILTALIRKQNKNYILTHFNNIFDKLQVNFRFWKYPTSLKLR